MCQLSQHELDLFNLICGECDQASTMNHVDKALTTRILCFSMLVQNTVPGNTWFQKGIPLALSQLYWSFTFEYRQPFSTPIFKLGYCLWLLNLFDAVSVWILHHVELVMNIMYGISRKEGNSSCSKISILLYMVPYPSAQICASNPKWKWRPNFGAIEDRSGDPRGGDEAGVIAGPPPCPDCSRLCLSQEGGKSLGSSENCYTAQGIGLCALSINLMNP